MIRINKLVARNRASSVQDAGVNRLYFPHKIQVPASQMTSIEPSQLNSHNETRNIEIPITINKLDD